jgi:hypothetical protein
MSYQDINSESLQLIIELQLGDLESVSKGKQRAGEVRDGELAVEVFKSELKSLNRFRSDQILSQSIARAVVQDGAVVASYAQSEEQARHDREQALRWKSGSATPIDPIATKAVLDDELLGKLKALYVEEYKSANFPEAESSEWAAKRAKADASKENDRTCTACGDAVPFFYVARCPCSHEYCRECLTELFKASITDESLFPPRCCKQPIALHLNQIFLPSRVVQDFRAKEVEYSVGNRTYCHRATCSAFIPPDAVQDDVATCPVCSNSTCTICKGPTHESDCPADTLTLELLQIADDNGWQRCRACHRLVELETGCNHMSKNTSLLKSL